MLRPTVPTNNKSKGKRSRKEAAGKDAKKALEEAKGRRQQGPSLDSQSQRRRWKINSKQKMKMTLYWREEAIKLAAADKKELEEKEREKCTVYIIHCLHLKLLKIVATSR